MRNRLVFNIIRKRFVKIDKITIQINIVFIHSPQPRESVRINGMEKKHGDIVVMTGI